MTKILLIDDCKEIRDSIGTLLELRGYHVRTAGNEDDAMRLLRDDVPDVAITDIIMPDKDGIDVISQIKLEAPEVGIIAISGGFSPQGRSPFLNAAKKIGAEEILAKPLEMERLVQAIERLIKDT